MEQVCQTDGAAFLSGVAGQQQQLPSSVPPVLRYSRPPPVGRSTSGHKERRFAAIYEALSIEEKELVDYLPASRNGPVSLPPTSLADVYRGDVAAPSWEQSAFAHAAMQTACSCGSAGQELFGLEDTCPAAAGAPASFSSWNSVGSAANHSFSSQADIMAETHSGSYDAAVTVQEFHNNSGIYQDHTAVAAAAAAAAPCSSAAAYDVHWAAAAGGHATGHFMQQQQQQQQQLPPLPPTPLARTNSGNKNNFGGQGGLMGAHTMPIPFLSMQLPTAGSLPSGGHDNASTVGSVSPKNQRKQFQRSSSLTGGPLGTASSSSSSMAAGSSGNRSHPGSFSNLQQQQLLQLQHMPSAAAAAAPAQAAAQAAALSNTISCPLPRPPMGAAMQPHQQHQLQQQQQHLLLQQLHQQQQLQHRQALRVLEEEVQQLLQLGRQLEAAKAAASVGSPAAAACEVAAQMHEKAMNRALQAKAALQMAGAAAGAFEAADILQQHDAQHHQALLAQQQQKQQQQWAAQQQWMQEQHEQQQWYLQQQQQQQFQQQLQRELRKEQREREQQQLLHHHHQQQQQRDLEQMRDSHSPHHHRPVCRSATFAVHGGNEGFHRAQSGPLNPAAHDKLTQLMRVQKMQAALQDELLQLLPMA